MEQLSGSDRFTLRTDVGLMPGFQRRGTYPQTVLICDNAGSVVGSLEFRDQDGILHVSTNPGEYVMAGWQLKDDTNGRTILTLRSTSFRLDRVAAADGYNLKVRCHGRLRGKLVMELHDEHGAAVLTVRRPPEPRLHPLDQAEAVVARAHQFGNDTLLYVAMGYLLYEIHLQPIPGGGG